ncbi:MAG: UDP-N-acetylmuramoyl-L-alanine--D-glutamate ligase [Peptoniphilaceae bacterium]|nr:UDP-N-acetylmuramoyl-L-alanine--D-glutamate ligase [Peptoniphilaceae bacterium]MDD7383584.1 UDP-N-acetylmuramoyl-L-alanine--D-glutamate ligase [Peptoniphilaceae bacterium]MDY3738756.1 UDP-N-acetylmuramoyl-L-alanine--D-glutamate ligase [Peptoniphilaceae bacterium]
MYTVIDYSNDIMKIKEKNILIYGLGVSGISSVKTLSKMGANVFTYDEKFKTKDDLMGYKYSPLLREEIFKNNYDYVIKSPGIKPDDKLFIELKSKYEVISDIEMSYLLFPEKRIISITGTNGKTTTVSLVAHILNENGKKSLTVGNIGEGILWKMYNEDAIFIEELSSFQLHDIYKFHTKFAAITNVTEDHIDWHKSFDDYKKSKFNITKNQTKEDFLIINYDDKVSKEIKTNAKKIYFSSKNKIVGMYLKDDKIMYNNDVFVNTKDLNLIGIHNFENIMCASLLLLNFGLKKDEIVKGLKSFKAIKHRLQFIKEINGVKYFNDSKGTNVDSTLKALKSFDKNVILIAGGYDKNIDYSPMIDEFKKIGKYMVLLGQTAEKIAKINKEKNVDFIVVDTIKDAIKYIYNNSKKGDVALLSPASASWDMYDNYEQRGDDFINEVNKLLEEK